MTIALNALEFGDAGPPVVVLHGVFGSARNWTTVGRRLGETHRVFALDLRNHGGSPWADDMSFPAMAGDVLAFIEPRGLRRPVVIGHSLGGKVALTLALRHGGAVAGLVAVDIAPVAYTGSFLSYVDAMRAVDLSRVSRRTDADAMLADAVPNPGVRAFLLQSLELGDPPRWRLNLNVLAAEMDSMGAYPDADAGLVYDGPALFLAGGKSDYVRPEHHDAIRRLCPAAQIETVAGAGHWVHAEQPDAFVARVRAFLDGVRDQQEGQAG